MSFLLDTDICSAYLKGNSALYNRFIQHGGRLHLTAVSLGELFTWALRSGTSPSRLRDVLGLLPLVHFHEVNLDVARRFGEVDADLLDRGISVPDVDLLNAAVALLHGLTMVTHNTQDYSAVTGLTLVDWLAP